MKKSGFVAIVGRPNVGKSTLLNYLLGTKLSITSRKPQTTRHRILGIHTIDETQIIYVDTPGLHGKETREINRVMNKTVQNVILDVDVIIFVVEALKWRDDDELVLASILKSKLPVIVVINKVDQAKDKQQQLPFIEGINRRIDTKSIIPVSALKGENLSQLEPEVIQLLSEGPHYFPDDQITDRNIKFTLAEFIREKCFRATGDELPYSLTVTIEQMELKKTIYHISGLILVEREDQKKILIGEGGEKLKLIGSTARKDMERLLGKKVFLRLWVKVKRGWADDANALRDLGYHD